MNATTYIPTGNDVTLQKPPTHVRSLYEKVKDYLYLNYLSNYSDRPASLRSAKKELEQTGLSRFQLDRSESKHITCYLNPDEHIKAAVHGHVNGVGGALIVATGSRILYLYEIPLFSNFEEFSFDVVSGISINRAGLLSSIRIFSKFKTYELDYVNTRQAERFVRYVESQLYHRNQPKPSRYEKEVHAQA